MFRIATDNHIAGDYNADGKVDDSDDDVWKADFGSTSKLDADGNDDTFVDAADYVIWRDNLGNTVGEEIGGPVVPEPALPCLMCAMAVAAAFGRRRQFLSGVSGKSLEGFAGRSPAVELPIRITSAQEWWCRTPAVRNRLASVWQFILRLKQW